MAWLGILVGVVAFGALVMMLVFDRTEPGELPFSEKMRALGAAARRNKEES